MVYQVGDKIRIVDNLCRLEGDEVSINSSMRELEGEEDTIMSCKDYFGKPLYSLTKHRWSWRGEWLEPLTNIHIGGE